MDNEIPLPPKVQITPHRTIGIDLGLINFIAMPFEKVANPKNLQKTAKKLVKAQRKLARKQVKSNNFKKCKFKVAKIHQKINNQRKDFQHKLSSRLVNDNQVDTIFMEDLNIAGMTKNHKLARSIQDASWGSFQNQIRYKLEWLGKNYGEINRFLPSSKLCKCGFINHSLTLADRIWTCPSCGRVNDRDLLSSENIAFYGLREKNLVGPDRSKFTLREPVEYQGLALN